MGQPVNNGGAGGMTFEMPNTVKQPQQTPQNVGIANALRQQPQQQPVQPKPISLNDMLAKDSEFNPINKINEMFGTVVSKGAELVNNIFTGQWKQFGNHSDEQGGGLLRNLIGGKGMLANTQDMTTMPSPTSGVPVQDEEPSNQALRTLTDTSTPGMTPFKLGSLSAKYEVGPNGGAGSISNAAGDKGGASYGTYQLASKAGSLNGFLRSSEYGKEFAGLQPGTSDFNAKWKQLAASDPNFGEAQHAYMEKANYAPVRAAADKLGVPNTEAINQVLWSTGVQHGGGGGASIIKKSFKPGMSEREIINNIYDNRAGVFERSKFYNSSAARRNVQKSVLNRFREERRDALAMLET